MQIQDMAQNNFIQDTIDCEAIKIQTDAHQNYLSSNGIMPKST